MWFLSNKVLLTKDNLAKRNWQGDQKCCFCDSCEIVDHLFISCPFAKIIWLMIYFAYNIPPPSNVTNMFGNWLNGVDKINKRRIRIGVSALCWSIWNCRNDIIFNRSKGSTFLQVIRLAVHWIQLWSCLLPSDQREPMDIGCTRLLTVAQDFFSQAGWRRARRLNG
jgi:two-component response regulator (ARR-B family)